jgi:putative solute:sodium symporter small subunit
MPPQSSNFRAIDVDFGGINKVARRPCARGFLSSHVGGCLVGLSKPQPKPAVSRLPTESEKRLYWKKNLLCLSVLMGVWFFVSFGCGVFFVDWFDQFKVPGSNLKLGFWIAQQGSIYAFIILIAVYAAVMNRLDRELLACTESDGGRDS